MVEEREQSGWGSGGQPGDWMSRTPYGKWVQRQGIPVIEGYGVSGPTSQEFGYWDKIGAEAYFVQLYGMEGITGQYVVRLAAGGATKRERHLYEKLIYIIQGNGATVVEDGRGQEHTFEWHEGSIFTIPLNCHHRIFAHGEPAVYTAFTTAPMVFDLFYNEEFVYHTPFVFKERFDGEADFFRRDVRKDHRWYTNFIPDVRTAQIDVSAQRGPGAQTLLFEMADNSLMAHIAQWPSGRYMLAHYHAGGAIILIVKGEGFGLMWSNEYGEHPFEDGHADKIVRVDWKPGSTYSPPANWFHQHFNAGSGPALHIALRNNSLAHPLGVRAAHATAMTSAIPLEREDPGIRQMYVEDLRRHGINPDMPLVVGASD